MDYFEFWLSKLKEYIIFYELRVLLIKELILISVVWL